MPHAARAVRSRRIDPIDPNEPQLPAHRVVWQVRIEEEGYYYLFDYSPEHSRQLEESWQLDWDLVDLEDEWGYTVWQVSLHRMVQWNAYSETVRRVRRIIVTHE